MLFDSHNSSDVSELERLTILNRLDVLDTPFEPEYDNIVRLAKHLFDVPIALISIVDDHRQWFKACEGLDVRETPRDQAFCSHTIKSDAPLIVPDAFEDERFSDNPLVTGEPKIRFYAGVPLIVEPGVRIGSLCVIDQKPRSTPRDEELELLQNFADIVTRLIIQESKGRNDQAASPSVSDGQSSKTEFLAMMGHELRTPMNAILGFSDLLQTSLEKESMDAKFVEYAKYINQSANRLMDHLNSILDWSDVENSLLALSPESIEVAKLIDSAIDSLENSRETALDVKVASFPDGTLNAWCDPDHTAKCIARIIDNAERFSNAQCLISVSDPDTEKGFVHIHIDDRGPGMSAADSKKAFAPFSQVDTPLTRTVDGLGLGLPLSARITEIQGGKLSTQNLETGGLRVTLAIPVSKSSP